MLDIVSNNKRELKRTLNLRERKDLTYLLAPLKFSVVGIFLFIYLFNLTAIAPGNSYPSISATFAAEHEEDEEVDFDDLTQEQLEERLAELERQIAEERRLVEETQAQSRTLESEIQRIDSQIRQAEYTIQAINITLQQLAEDIFQTEASIEDTEDRIDNHKETMARSIRSIHQAESQNLLVILLQNDQISDFFNNINDLMMVQDNVKSSLEAVNELRENLINQKEQLQTERTETDNLRNLQENQRERLRATQQERELLLQITQGQEALYQAMLEDTRRSADEIRNQIIRLVTGEELTFETAYQLARAAEASTGVRASLIIAILEKESNLGRNVGQCRLTDLSSGSSAGINTGRIFSSGIHPTRDIPPLIAIAQNLGLDPLQVLISCPLSIGYGGAMGPSQFIPSTWAIFAGYERSGSGWVYNRNNDRIGRITGNLPSNPWNNRDAITATSLYISQLYNDSVCSAYARELGNRYPERELREECAAARYYSGGNWRNPANYFGYGVDVRERADRFQRDIDILEGR